MIFFSKFSGDPPLSGLGAWSYNLKERLIVLGAVGIVAVVLFFWALAIRKRRRRRKERHHRHHRSAAPDSPGGLESKAPPPEEKRRRRRRSELPRNPTLAETGGLPPLRSEISPPEPPSGPT